MTPQEWLLSGDTGVSSLTIFHVMTGTITTPTRSSLRGIDAPRDSDDFGRCYRLLKAFPEWRERLPEIAAMVPKWTPLVERWDELESMFETDRSACNSLIFQLYPACMLADGYVQTGNHSWRRQA
jgi:hypothetical protein